MPYLRGPVKAQHIRHAPADESKHPKEISKFAAEFIGTFMLVFTVCMNDTTLKLGTTLAHALGIFGPLSIACVLMVLVYSLGSISGAHLNPAVTVSVYLQEGISLKEGMTYMIVQCAAGVLAGFSTMLIDGYDDTSDGNVVGPRDGRFVLGAPVVEFVYTLMLCFVVLNVAVAEKTKGNNYYGVAIGFVIVAGGYGGGYVSGGAFNPAVVLGVNFMGFNPNNPYLHVFYVPVYIAVQLAAGILAPTLMHIVRPETKCRHTDTGAVLDILYKIEEKFDPDDTSEFIGAFYIALGITLNGIAAVDAGTDGNPGCFLSVGATLMCMIWAMGDISGGLFNPAVTLAYLGRFHGTGCGVGPEKICDFKVSPKEGIKYLLCQCLGAVAGMGVTILIWLASGRFPVPPIGPQPGGGNATVSENHTDGQAFFAETFGTFLFCFVSITVATTHKPLKEFKAMAIGSAYIAGGYAFGPLSGGILNPAITLAACVVNLSAVTNPRVPILYILAEFFGGVLAVAVFKFLTHPHEYEMDAEGAEGYKKLAKPEGYESMTA
jgi:aquaporin Z